MVWRPYIRCEVWPKDAAEISYVYASMDDRENTLDYRAVLLPESSTSVWPYLGDVVGIGIICLCTGQEVFMGLSN